jgi:hypothetical protein
MPREVALNIRRDQRLRFGLLEATTSQDCTAHWLDYRFLSPIFRTLLSGSRSFKICGAQESAEALMIRCDSSSWEFVT